MSRVEYGGSWYQTIRQAARAWAAGALPDVSVIGNDETTWEAAEELEAFWWAEADRIGEAAPPHGVDVEEWRAECRLALCLRIDPSYCAHSEVAS